MFGFIYELKSKDKSITEIYIGSTWDMQDRLKYHKYRCNNKNGKKYNTPLYIYIREHGGVDNFEMIEIDSGECEDELELHCAEQFYIDLYGGIENLLNSQDAIEDIDNTKEKRLEKFRCDCGGSYAYKHKSTHIKTNKHQNYIKKNKLI